MRRRAGVLAAVPLLLIGACATAPEAPSGGGGAATGPVVTGVDVDTPALRRAKREAGVEQCPTTDPKAKPVAGGLPDVELACLGGGPPVRLSALRGPLVVNLWAQWCGPCREELPIYQELHKRAGDRLQVLGIDYQDTQPGAALDLIRQTGVTYPLLADPDATVRVPFRTRALPGIVLVDAQGRVTHLEYTAFRSYGELRAMVKQYLGLTV